MKVLVVGAGAREHALVWKLVAERSVADVVCAPGNPGIARLAACVPVDLRNPEAILQVARRSGSGFTIVGPEVPLERGVADLFAASGLLLLGPTRAAAQLECSKAFAKEFMKRHRIPTARHKVCLDAEEALTAVTTGEFGFPVVLKADGLAAGKGVIVATDVAAAREAIQILMVDRRFGDAGARLVIEEHLSGAEVSFFVICDGRSAVPLGAAQDHKRAFDNDEGPNTGGMGAFAPSPLVTSRLGQDVMREIVTPTLEGLRGEGWEYRGFLYVGLMLTKEGPRVIEFNVRLGDPEAQVIVPMMESEFLPVALAAAAGDLATTECVSSQQRHVGVVLASAGYPGRVEGGKPIEGLREAEGMRDVLVFHAGTILREGHICTDGGRVLTVVGRGDDFQQAIARAYAAAAVISFEGKQLRSDIGRKALALHM